MKQNISRREAVSSLIKGSIGAAAVYGSISAITNSCKSPNEKNAIIPVSSTPKKPILMKVGCQHGGTGKKNLEFLARHGVFHLDPGNGDMPKFIPNIGWDLEDSLKKREACEKYGITLEAYHLPLPSDEMKDIMLGKCPERDRQIEMLQQMISVAGKTGVRTLNYNTIINELSWLRTGHTIDSKRGNASYYTWNYKKAIARNEPKTSAGDVSVDQMFERITYLLDRLLPVAEEYNVRLANHIADPPMPEPYRGVHRWNSPDVFKGIQRFSQLYDSPSHGFNLCLGSTAEGLEDPKNEIIPIIKWVGERKQIFNIHLRNILGSMNNFQEVYPDNGVMDFLEIVRTLWDVGFDGMLMPDHLPEHEDPDSYNQGHAYAFGYFNALLKVLESEI